MNHLDFPRLMFLLPLLLTILPIRIINTSILLQTAQSFSVVPTTTTIFHRMKRPRIIFTATNTAFTARRSIFVTTASSHPTATEIAKPNVAPFFSRIRFNHCWNFRIGNFNNHFGSNVRWMNTNDNDSNEKDDNDNENDNSGNSIKENQKIQKTKKTTTTRRSTKKFEVIESSTTGSQNQAAKLAALFDDLAKKDGFDSSMAYYSKDTDNDTDNDGDDDNIIIQDDESEIEMDDDDTDNEEYLDFGDPDETFERVASIDDNRTSSFYVPDTVIESMEDRIKAAQNDMNTGRVTVPKDLDYLATSIDIETTTETLRRLGFQPESSYNYKSNDNKNMESSRIIKRDAFTLNTDPMVCSACGSDFQSADEHRPGYIPRDKYEIQEQLAKKMQQRNPDGSLSSSSWSAEDEVEWLLKSSSSSSSSNAADSEDVEEDFDDDDDSDDSEEIQQPQRRIICKRCHTLQNYGTVDTLLRPGWTTKEPLLSQDNFRNLLRPLRSKTAVIIALIDIFDFSGSVLTELDTIVGKNNPVIIAANKADLLPPSMGQLRIEKWVRQELDYLGIQSIRNIAQQSKRYDDDDNDNDDRRRSNPKTYTSQTSVRLISCKTGMGVEAMLNKARKIADELDCDIYVIGSANSGKSTLLNRILSNQDPNPQPASSSNRVLGRQQPSAFVVDSDDDDNDDDYGENDYNAKPMIGKVRAGNKNKFKDIITTSPLPGTTLQFLSIDLGGADGKDGSSNNNNNNQRRRLLYDTPGLLVPGTITQFLTPEELKLVVPRNRVEPITYRIASGKCVLIGGLARIEVINDSKPFLLTFFISNSVKLHPTDTSKADDYVAKHTGTLLTPPLLRNEEEIPSPIVPSNMEEHILTIEGCGWKEAAADITITGLGWIAITGAGTASMKVHAPKGVIVEVRPPLMPFDVWETTAKYTGSRTIKRKGNTSSSSNASSSSTLSSSTNFKQNQKKYANNNKSTNKTQHPKKKGLSRY